MTGPTLVWTGQRSSGGLLYQAYTNHADVMHYSQRVGYVLALADGYYQPRLDGMMGDNCATADQAARKVVEMHEEFRS